MSVYNLEKNTGGDTGILCQTMLWYQCSWWHKRYVWGKKDSDNTEFKRDSDELNFECKDFEEYNKCILFTFSFLHECTKTIFRMGKWV